MRKPTYTAHPATTVTAETLYHKKPQLEYTWYELDQGVLVVCEPGGFGHSEIGIRLSSRLWAYVKEHDLGRVTGPDGTFVLARNPDTARIPDVAFVRKDRVPYGRAAERFFEGYPDFAIEIVSPSDRFPTVEKKVQQYLTAGTSLVWVIRPKDQTAFVYTPYDVPKKFTAADVLSADPVVPGWSIALRELFAP